MGVNNFTRNKVLIKNTLFFAGGHPKFHILPGFVRWGKWLSIYWLDTELVVKVRKDKNYI